MFESLTNIDSRVLRTLRYLVSRPGTLTVAYLEGLRKPFINPVQLFLLTNVLFFATDALTGGTVFATPLQEHLYRQPWSETAQTLIADRLRTLNTTAALYAPRFDHEERFDLSNRKSRDLRKRSDRDCVVVRARLSAPAQLVALSRGAFE